MITEILNRIDPEKAHQVAGYGLQFLGALLVRDVARKLVAVNDPSLRRKVFGLEFENPVGVAAGFDKKGRLVRGLESLGFGHVEVGTVTAHAQSGNDRPRIFKNAKDRSITNRMGFNNDGAAEMQKTLAARSHRAPLGVSIGKSKITSVEDAPDDYATSYAKLYEHGDYFVINVSSPNTPGLRGFQDHALLETIVTKLTDYRNRQKVRKPLLIKIAPDLTPATIDDVLAVIAEHHLDGIVATNTRATAEGGISGAPLKDRSTEVIRYIHDQAPQLPIIGVGGIFTAKDAKEKLVAGASLVQVYSGLIYGGPLTARRINRGLAGFGAGSVY